MPKDNRDGTVTISSGKYREMAALQKGQWQYAAMRRTQEALTAITTGCRADMHEPDNNDVRAVVTGTTLDNAMGDCAPDDACGEIIVSITDCGGTVAHFSLATLIALARVADTRQFLTNGDH